MQLGIFRSPYTGRLTRGKKRKPIVHGETSGGPSPKTGMKLAAGMKLATGMKQETGMELATGVKQATGVKLATGVKQATDMKPV